MLIFYLNKIPCRLLADYMRSAKLEFILKKNKAENRILNDFTLSSCKLRLTLTFKSQFEQFPYREDNFLHSCLKTMPLRGRRYLTNTISYCSFSRINRQVEHRHVQHIRKWCGQQHEAFGVISRLIKRITLFKIIRKGWSLTSTAFKTRKRKIMKTFKIKYRQKTFMSATQSKMAADVRKLSRSIWTSSPYAMATKLGKSKSNDTATKFSSKNRSKSKF